MSHSLTAAELEEQVREFAAEFDTPNTRRALALCESGRLSWGDVYTVFVAAIVKARALAVATS